MQEMDASARVESPVQHIRYETLEWWSDKEHLIGIQLIGGICDASQYGIRRIDIGEVIPIDEYEVIIKELLGVQECVDNEPHREVIVAILRSGFGIFQAVEHKRPIDELIVFRRFGNCLSKLLSSCGSIGIFLHPGRQVRLYDDHNVKLHEL